MSNIIKKLNKNKIQFTINNNIISFQINGEPYSIQPTKNKNKFLIKNRCDSMFSTYKLLIQTLNKYQIIKKW
jgi:hypothetical protein